MIRWTVALALVVTAVGCAGNPPPMTVLMPTYSFERDGFESLNDPAPARTAPVANAE